MWWRAIVVVGLLGGLAVVPRASAQPAASADNEAEAQACFTRGQRQYDLGNYSSAIDEFKRGYLLSGLPAFLLNIAQAYRLSGDDANAADYFRRFLQKAEADDPARESAQRVLDEIEHSQTPSASAPVGVPVVLVDDDATIRASLGTEYGAYIQSGLTYEGYLERKRGKRVIGFGLGGFGVGVGAGGALLLAGALAKEEATQTRLVSSGVTVGLLSFYVGYYLTMSGRRAIQQAEQKRRPRPSLSMAPAGVQVRF